MNVKASKEVLHLQSVVDDLESQLAKAQERLHDAMYAEHPFQPGSVVLVDGAHRDGGFVARVERLVVRYNKVEMEVAKRLKSGNFSTFRTHVHSFMSVEPHIEPEGESK